MLSFASFASFEDTKNGVTYSFNNGTLTISKIDGNNMPERAVRENGVQNAMRSYGKNIAYINEVIIGAGITSIGNYAFIDCASLNNVTIPNSVETIGDGAFYYCKALKSVTIPNSVEAIGQQAFQHCTALTSVIIPDTVTSIGDRVFYMCESLTSVTIPGRVTSIGINAFYNCISLRTVTFNGSKEQWEQLKNDGKIQDTILQGATVYGYGETPTATGTIVSCTGKTLTVKKVWKNDGDGPSRSAPVFNFYRSDASYVPLTEGTDYTRFSCTYNNGANNVDVFDENGNITDKARKYNKWVYQFAMFSHGDGYRYEIGEKPMEGYTSDAYVY